MAASTVTVYTRENCHLCEEALTTVRSVAESVPRTVTIDVVNVDERADLREEYGDRVPYVLVDGTPKFKYRVDESELRGVLSDP
ncbi:glutaredoxin family protein [Halostella pelagica]|uniref:glutaredoxin family protein n=1 Tax=Halostella pelagica TaxID=2583824 RepID=UPI00107FF2CC